jgi:hypothetical protein
MGELATNPCQWLLTLISWLLILINYPLTLRVVEPPLLQSGNPSSLPLYPDTLEGAGHCGTKH